MDTKQAVTTLSALSQTTRLETYRLLASREPEGVSAGDLARLQGVPQNTLSAHLGILARAGLVRSTRQARSIIYRADLERLGALMQFLLRDCCGGRPDVCLPIISGLSPCCPPQEDRKHD